MKFTPADNKGPFSGWMMLTRRKRITTERVAPASGVIHADESVSPPQGDIDDAAPAKGRP